MFSNFLGRILFGLAVSAHAYSIYDLTSWSRSSEPRTRAVAIGGILAGMLLLYWPLLSFLANLFVGSVRVQVDNVFGVRPPSVTTQFIFIVIGFALTIWFSAWLGRRLSSRGPGTEV